MDVIEEFWIEVMKMDFGIWNEFKTELERCVHSWIFSVCRIQTGRGSWRRGIWSFGMASLRQSTLLERWRKRFLLFTFWKIQDRQPSLIVPVLKVFFSIFLQEPELGIWTIKFKFAKYCFEIRIFLSWYIWWKLCEQGAQKAQKAKQNSRLLSMFCQRLAFCLIICFSLCWNLTFG